MKSSWPMTTTLKQTCMKTAFVGPVLASTLFDARARRCTRRIQIAMVAEMARSWVVNMSKVVNRIPPNPEWKIPKRPFCLRTESDEGTDEPAKG